MDFKSLLNKLDSMEAPPKSHAAPQLPKAVQLNEDAQLRVLSGTSSYISEAKKKKDDEVKEEKSSTGGTIDRSKKGVTKHTQNPNRFSDEPHSEPASKAKSQSAADKEKDKAADKADAKDSKDYEKAHGKGSVTRVKDGKKVESIEPEFKSKFMKMVEAKKDEADKKKADKKKKMEEGAKPDFLDMDKDGDKKEPMKKAVADKKGAAPKKGVNPFAKKEVNAKSKKDESVTRSKQVVAEGVESRLSFKQMMTLVVESGGQQQIDPLDKELFAWATRIAKQKLGEGMKAEVYAGLTYERMGGHFEMYDVLSEDQK
jgi:hypothetical protein